MRTDCVRDNRQTWLTHASNLGFDTWRCKRGCYVQFEDNGNTRHGRVLGGVTVTGGEDKGTRYIEVAVLLGNLDCLAIRWINPASIQRCTTKSPLSELLILCSEDIGALDVYVKQNA